MNGTSIECKQSTPAGRSAHRGLKALRELEQQLPKMTIEDKRAAQEAIEISHRAAALSEELLRAAGVPTLRESLGRMPTVPPRQGLSQPTRYTDESYESTADHGTIQTDAPRSTTTINYIRSPGKGSDDAADGARIMPSSF